MPQKHNSKKEATFGAKIKEMWEVRQKKLRAQWQMYVFLAFIFGMNAILYITRACYFRDMVMLNPEYKNSFYMLSRASGK